MKCSIWDVISLFLIYLTSIWGPKENVLNLSLFAFRGPLMEPIILGSLVRDEWTL